MEASEYERILLDREKWAKDEVERLEKKNRQARTYYEVCRRDRINFQEWQQHLAKKNIPN